METRLTRRHFLQAGVTALGATALAACAQPTPTAAPQPTAAQSEPTTVTEPTTPPTEAPKQHKISFAWWTGGEAANKVFEEAISRFEKSHPNFTVNRITAPYGDFTTKILTMYGSGNAPDAHGVPWGTVWAWADKGVLLDLGPFVERDAGELEWDDMWPAITAACHYPAGDKIVALPRETFGLMIMLYNATLFQQSGVTTPDQDYEAGAWTWEQWANRAKAVTRFGADGRRETMGTSFWGVGYWTLQLAMPSYGLSMFGQDGKHFAIDDPKIVEWIRLIRRMIVEDQSMGKPDESAQFDWGASGKQGIQLDGTWGLPNFRETWVDFEWDFVPTPKGTCCHSNIHGNDYHAVNGSSYADQEGGWEIIKFLNSPEEDLWWALNMYGPPFRRRNLQAWTDEVQKGLPKNGWKYVPDMMEQAVPWAAVPFAAEVSNLADNELGQAVNGERPVDEVIASVVTKVDEAIANFAS